MPKTELIHEEKNQIPCIVGLRSRESSAKWANYTIKDYKYPVVFTIYSLEDILITSHGEYLKRGYIVEINTCQPDSFIEEFSNSKIGKSNKYQNATEHEYIFNPPRKITYFINFISNISKTDYERTLSFKCPKAGSLQHNKIINNKAIQKLLLNDSNLLVVFLNKNKERLLFDEFLKDNKTKELIRIVNFDQIIEHVCEYLRKYFEKNELVQRLIVKNTWWLSCRGSNVMCVYRNDLKNGYAEKKIGKILDLSSKEEENFQILIEYFYEPLVANQNNLYHKIRCYYQKSDENGQSQISDLYLTLGFREVSNLDSETFCVNQNNFAYFLHDKFRIKLNEESKKESQSSYKNFIDQIRCIGNEFHRNLRHFLEKHGIDVSYETPMFAFDIIMTRMEDEQIGSTKFKANLVEINDLDSLYAFSNSYFLTNGNCNKLKTFHNYLLSKSYDYMLRGMRIACLGSNENFFAYCRKNDIITVRIKDNENFGQLKYLDEETCIIHADLYKTESYESECERVANILLSNGNQINAVVSLNAAFVPFKVLLQEKLNLKFNFRTTYEESIRNRNKLRVYQTIANKPIGYEYVEKVEAILNTTIKLNEICLNTKTRWPKCLKQSISNRSLDKVCIVKNEQELLTNVIRLKSELKKQTDESELFVTSYYFGTNHSFNLIMSDGQCLFCISTNENDLDEQEILQIENCIVHKLRILGMTNGVFSCEIVRTLLGMKIIKVNPCAKNCDAVLERTGINLLKAELILNLPIVYLCQRI